MAIDGNSPKTDEIKELIVTLQKIDAISLKRSDIGAAQLFSDIFRDKHRYNISAREWFVYDNGIWAIDNEGVRAKASLKLLGQALVQYAASADLHDESEKASYIRYAAKWLTRGYRDGLIKDARDVHFISREDLDKDLFTLNCQNCVITLKNGIVKTEKHRPDLLLSKMTGTNYQPEAKCPRWNSFMDEITEGDTDKKKYLQKIAGLALVGEVTEHKFFIVYGSTTRNGKSTFTETLLTVMGTYGTTINPETLAIQKVDSRRASGDVARLAGIRLAICSEAPRRMPLDSALLKKMTGGDRILARHLQEREFEFKPQFTLLMNTNYLPSSTDSTIFSSGRIAVCEFKRHFREEEQDKRLKDKLLKESAGILNWMIEGYQLYLKEGLEPPESVRKETETYEDDSDRIKVFCDEKLIKADGEFLSVKDGYIAYTEWCDESGYQALGKQAFVDELKTKKLFRASATINKQTVKRVIVGYSGFYKTKKNPFTEDHAETA